MPDVEKIGRRLNAKKVWIHINLFHPQIFWNNVISDLINPSVNLLNRVGLGEIFFIHFGQKIEYIKFCVSCPEEKVNFIINTAERIIDDFLLSQTNESSYNYSLCDYYIKPYKKLEITTCSYPNADYVDFSNLRGVISKMTIKSTFKFDKEGILTLYIYSLMAVVRALSSSLLDAKNKVTALYSFLTENNTGFELLWLNKSVNKLFSQNGQDCSAFLNTLFSQTDGSYLEWLEDFIQAVKNEFKNVENFSSAFILNAIILSSHLGISVSNSIKLTVGLISRAFYLP